MDQSSSALMFGGRSYLGRGRSSGGVGGGGGVRGDEAAGSFAASAGEMGHCAALVRNSSDPLGLPLEGELIKTPWPVDGCTEEAGKTAAAFFCVFSRPINHVLLRNLRADVDCLGYCE